MSRRPKRGVFHCPHCGGEIAPRPIRKAKMTDEEMRGWLQSKAEIVAGPHDTPCWLWPGNKNARGYGQLQWKGRTWFVHRASFTLWKGDIPEGAVIRHLKDCDKLCFNPEHLEPGTQAQNIQEYWRGG